MSKQDLSQVRLHTLFERAYRGGPHCIEFGDFALYRENYVLCLGVKTKCPNNRREGHLVGVLTHRKDDGELRWLTDSETLRQAAPVMLDAIESGIEKQEARDQERADAEEAKRAAQAQQVLEEAEGLARAAIASARGEA